MVPVAMGAGAVVGGLAFGFAMAVGRGIYQVALSGASTPSTEDYSREQALVMRGEIDEAFASFEKIIAGDPNAVRARTEAAELYARKKNYERAAVLFREIQRVPGVPAGSDVYASNRLADLYLGPLSSPEKALAELRGLVRRHPNSKAAAHPRDAIAKLESTLSTDGGPR